MVRHQAISVYRTAELVRQLTQMQQIYEVIASVPEARTPVVATLHDVRGDFGKNQARLPWHEIETSSRNSG
jgi:hypothetical protein